MRIRRLLRNRRFCQERITHTHGDSPVHDHHVFLLDPSRQQKGLSVEILMLVLCVPFIPKSFYLDPYQNIKEPFSESKEIAELVE